MVNDLYSDYHKEKSLKNTGYRDKQTAINTINLIKKRGLKYQFDVINTMKNRALYHQHKTQEMDAAIEIFNIWLNKYNKKK